MSDGLEENQFPELPDVGDVPPAPDDLPVTEPPEDFPTDEFAHTVTVGGVERTIPPEDEELDDEKLGSLGDDKADIEARLIEIRRQLKALRVESVGLQLHHEKIDKRLGVHIAKEIKGAEWKSLSIPKGKSDSYNKDKFSQPKMTKDYTDDMDKLI